MELFLVQHGEAKSEAEDPARPLTERGRQEVAGMAAWLREHGIRVEEIRHSGKLRAAQTAGILADALRPEGGCRAAEGLGPKDDPRALVQELDRALARAWMLVGHLPHLARLCGLLLAGDPEREPVKFRHAGVVHLVRDQGRWQLAWFVTPALL